MPISANDKAKLSAIEAACAIAEADAAIKSAAKPRKSKAAQAKAEAKADAALSVAEAKAAAATDAAAIAAAARTVAAAGYNGPSLSVRHGNPKLAALIARVKSPIQIADSLTVRDLSGLAAIKSVADESGAFNPLAIKLDAGVCSRLASRGLIGLNADESGLRLTDAGRATKA